MTELPRRLHVVVCDDFAGSAGLGDDARSNVIPLRPRRGSSVAPQPFSEPPRAAA